MLNVEDVPSFSLRLPRNIGNSKEIWRNDSSKKDRNGVCPRVCRGLPGRGVSHYRQCRFPRLFPYLTFCAFVFPSLPSHSVAYDFQAPVTPVISYFLGPFQSLRDESAQCISGRDLSCRKPGRLGEARGRNGKAGQGEGTRPGAFHTLVCPPPRPPAPRRVPEPLCSSFSPTRQRGSSWEDVPGLASDVPAASPGALCVEPFRPLRHGLLDIPGWLPRLPCSALQVSAWS